MSLTSNARMGEGAGLAVSNLRNFVIKQTNQAELMPTSNRMPEDDILLTELNTKTLPPPFDPWQLAVMVETSNILSQCVDVMEVNIDSFGFDLKPAMDEETFNEIKDKMQKTGGGLSEDDEIDVEFRRVKNFFKYCNRTMSFVQIRRRTRRDYELIGSGYWEILRNQLTGRITGLEWLPAHTMRIGRVDRVFTDVMMKCKTSDATIERIPDKRRFRRYAQVKEGIQKPVWYKEFGDPRLMDAEYGGRAAVERDKDGQITSIAPINEPGFPPFDLSALTGGRMVLATEVLQFCNYKSPRALPYGVPRWIGNLISLIGSRTSEEVNMLYFDNKTVPPGMLLVSGGRLSDDSVTRITNHIKENVKGAKNFHAILVVEATKEINPNIPNQGVPTLEWVSMRDAQNTDALFQEYDQKNIEKLISSFRFWGGYVSRTKEINVATAEVAKQLSEEQVFHPEREEFDSIVNRTVMLELDVNYWEFKSKGPQLASPKAVAEILNLVKPFLTGAEGREICEQVFGREFEELEEDWTKKPLVLVIAELTKAEQAAEEQVAKLAGPAGRGKPEADAEKEGKPAEEKAGQAGKGAKKAAAGEAVEKAAQDEEETVAFVQRLVRLRAVLKAASRGLAAAEGEAELVRTPAAEAMAHAADL